MQLTTAPSTAIPLQQEQTYGHQISKVAAVSNNIICLVEFAMTYPLSTLTFLLFYRLQLTMPNIVLLSF